MKPSATSITIAKTLASELLGTWHGKKCIRYLKKHDYQWRQMEWIGWYFEHRAKQILAGRMKVGPGPKVGNVAIDFVVQNQAWDFKAHPTKPNDGWIYLNDVEAVDACATHLGGIGWVIAVGNAVYDEDGSFKKWHDALKGSVSQYERDRVLRGARSRRRKKSFTCTHFLVAQALTISQITDAINAGLLKATMQKGQRNSNGGTRRAKYGMHMTRAAQSAGKPPIMIFAYP